MEFREVKGKQRAVVESTAELSSLRVIVSAFAKFFREGQTPESESTVATIDRTISTIDDSLTLVLSVRTQTQVDGPSIHSFGEPFMTIIDYAVATFEQRPELLTPFMSEDELLGAQTFFPPTNE